MRNLLGTSEMAFPLRLFLGENVIEMGLGAFIATLARLTEALGRAPVGFHLRHCVFLFSLVRTDSHRPLQAGRAVRGVRPRTGEGVGREGETELVWRLFL